MAVKTDLTYNDILNVVGEYDIEDNVFDFEVSRKIVYEYSSFRSLNNIEKLHLYDMYKLSILVDCLWYFGRGKSGDFYEKKKIGFLDRLGRDEFYCKLFN